MIYKPRPSTLPAHEIDALEAHLAEELSRAFGEDFRAVHVVEDMYGCTALYVHCEASIEHYAVDAQRINLSIARSTARDFQHHRVLECLVARVDIWDEKVAVGDEWFSRNDIVAWANREIDDATLLERGRSYW